MSSVCVYKRRNANLDLLRTLAILLVLIYHIFQDLPYQVTWLTEYGKYGVHLFFALSGYLIGGIWFREHALNGQVRTFHFIMNRILRTVPPYFAAFTLYFTIRSQFFSDPFYWEFLCFLQNYFEYIPYYDISWSLCIEEHFYLALPILLKISWKYIERARYRALLLLSIALLPGLLRLKLGIQTNYSGYPSIVSHLNYDFLAYGVLGAYLQQHFPHMARQISGYFYRICFITAMLLASLHWLPTHVDYNLGLPILAALLGLIVTGFANKEMVAWAKTKINYSIAIGSYSVYLTHVLALNLSELLTQKLKLPPYIDVMGCLILSAILGYCFYKTVEFPTIKLRHHLLQKY